MNNKIEKKINPKDKSLDNKSLQSKKLLNKKKNNSGIFRNNYKNYQYDYEEDFYEPYK